MVIGKQSLFLVYSREFIAMYASKKSFLFRTENSDNIFIYCIALASLLPMDGYWNYMRAGIPLTLILFKYLKVQERFSVKKDVLLFLTIWIICLFGSQFIIVGIPTLGNFVAFQKEIQRVVLYSLVIICAQAYKLNFFVVTKVVILMLLLNLGIQILQLFGNEAIFNILIEYYVSDEVYLRHFNLARLNLLSGFRSGSIFINPNVYMPFPMIFLSITLQALENSEGHSKRIIYTFISFLCILSIVLTGSRTGFVGVLMILIAYAILSRTLTVPLKVLSILASTFFAYLIGVQGNLRFSRLVEGLDDSLAVKVQGLITYLQNANPISFIIGNNLNIGSRQWVIDFEWAHVFVNFGLVGIMLYISLYYRLLKKIRTQMALEVPNLRIMYVCLTLSFAIVSLSATVFMAAPVFYFFSVFIFAKEIYT